MSKNINCYCNGTAKSEIYHGAKYVLYRCNNCGQVFVKASNQECIVQQYDDSEYFVEKNQYLDKWDELSVHFQSIMDKVKIFKPRGSLLDVGCSVGIFLEVASQNGYKAQGVEISKWASDFARENGFDVFTGGIIEAGYPDQSFDVIIMNHALEHMEDPNEVLQEIRRILKEDGLLVIGVPNYGSLMSKLKREKWISLLPEQHIWQFSHKTLTNLLITNGYKEVFFEAKENHQVAGWHPRSLARRVINIVSYILNNSEAMILFARKSRVKE